MNIQQRIAKPAHIPTDLVRDIDYFHLPGAGDDVHLAWRRLQDGPRIVWTPHNGGHWIATRGAEIKEIQLDHTLFSMRHATIPRSSSPSLPGEIDPPEHTPLRAILSPLFSPQILIGLQNRARSLTVELIEGFAPRGRCEFMSAFARHLPIAMFLSLVDLPFQDKDILLGYTDIRFRSPVAAERDAAKAGILNYLADVIRARRAKPGDDFISKILHAEVAGRPINDFEAQNMLATVMIGGLDTVASMMGFAMRFLAMNPGHRQQLLQDPSLVAPAVDELIRRHGVSNTARVVRRDTMFKGVELHENEQILAANCLFGLDDEQFENALTVDFKRPNASAHATFGNGPHRCPGANMARAEIRILLEELLPRIPNFALDPEKPPIMTIGTGNSVIELPLVWT